MTDEVKNNSEVLDNNKEVESAKAEVEAKVESVAADTLKEGEQESQEGGKSSDEGKKNTPTPKEEEMTLENVPLPEEKKELTKEDYILKRKERQLEREKKSREINEKNAEIERIRKENEELSKKAFLTEMNASRDPKRDDFETDEEFIDARLKYNIAKTAADRIRKQEQYELSKAKEEFSNKIAHAEQVGQDKYHDFDDVIEVLGKPGVLTNKPLVDAVLDSEYSADIFYLMGKYPSIREKLNEMAPIKAVKELAKLEQRFEQQLKSKKVVKQDQKIIEPINSKNGSPVKKPLSKYTEAELDALSSREFAKLRKEEAKSYTY